MALRQVSTKNLKLFVQWEKPNILGIKPEGEEVHELGTAEKAEAHAEANHPAEDTDKVLEEVEGKPLESLHPTLMIDDDNNEDDDDDDNNDDDDDAYDDDDDNADDKTCHP